MILYHVKCKTDDNTFFHALYLKIEDLFKYNDPRDVIYDVVYINKKEVKNLSYEEKKFLELIK